MSERGSGAEFMIRKRAAFCVFRVGEAEPIAVCWTKERADAALEMVINNELPWYERLNKTTASLAKKENSDER